MSAADRPAAGLYTAAWILGGLGLAGLVAGSVIGGYDRGLGGFLLVVGLAATVPGFIAAARYQLISRRDRPADRYHGPAPLILFVLQIGVVNVVSVLAFLLNVPPADTPVGFLAAAMVLLTSYLFVVWLFVVRSGALSWREMIRAAPLDASRASFDILIGAATMFGVAIAVGIIGSLVANLLGTSAPDVVPTMETGPEILITALAAGVLVPIGEEVFFRGYTMTAWLRDLGPRSALIRSALFFALVHIVNITAVTFGEGLRQATLEVLIIAPVGLALGWLYLKRGLIAAIAGHAAFNLLGVLVLVLAQNLPAPGAGG